MKFLKYITKMAIITLFFGFSAQSLAASSDKGAKVFIEKLGNKAIEIAADKNLDEKEKEKQISDLFYVSVDTSWIAKFVLGQYWRQASDEQKTKYVDLYKKFIASNFVPKFKDYSNQKIIVRNVIYDGSNEYTVQSDIDDPDNQSVLSVDYKVRKGANGSYIIYDIVTEGISFISTQRSEFGSILSRNGLDGLIEKLGNRVGS